MMRDPLGKLGMDGRVAIITGGAGLLGTEYSHTLASVGAHIVIADIDAERASSLADAVSAGSGVRALGWETDVSSPDSVRAMVEAALAHFGRVDALVNNAAIDPKFDQVHAAEHTNRFEDFPYPLWRQAVEVNITGMFLSAQAVSKAMLEAGKGVIVNVSSTYGLVGPDQRLYQREGESRAYKPVTYSVSKAAAHGLTRYLATYFAGTGIRVNTLSPGGVFAGHDEEFVGRYSDRTVLGRMARADEIGAALLFLVSDASSYMTGANLVVDGGWTAW
jgi:NAD(P)-dependent dehydrogenase (short-subunit alcohol dehydrogenase family)